MRIYSNQYKHVMFNVESYSVNIFHWKSGISLMGKTFISLKVLMCESWDNNCIIRSLYVRTFDDASKYLIIQLKIGFHIVSNLFTSDKNKALAYTLAGALSKNVMSLGQLHFCLGLTFVFDAYIQAGLVGYEHLQNV